MLEKTLESPLDCKEIKPVNPKGNQSRIFIGRTDAEAEALILWPPDVTSWLIRKGPDAGKDWRQEEKGMTEDEMVGWHHWLKGHEFEQHPGDGEGQGSPACCSPWGGKQSDMTETITITIIVIIVANRNIIIEIFHILFFLPFKKLLIYLLSCTESLLQHIGFLVVVFGIFQLGNWGLVP